MGVFSKEKSNVFETFKKWKALVENEIGKKLKCLRSDNGGEFTTSPLKIIVLLMELEGKRLFQELHKKMVCLRG